LEIVQATALARLLCTLSTGLGAELDEEPTPALRAAFDALRVDIPPARGAQSLAKPAHWIRAETLAPDAFPPFAALKQAFGFVPGVFRAQTLRRPALEAQVAAIQRTLLAEEGLSRLRRELALLAAASASLDAYSAGLHAELLRNLGLAAETAEAVVAGREAPGVGSVEAALIAFSERLPSRPDRLRPPDRA